LLDDPVQPVEIALDGCAAEPARHRRRDFVAESVAEHRRVTGALLDLRADQRRDLGEGFLPVDEEAEILFGRQPHDDPETIPPGGLQQGARRHRVRDTNGVDPVRRHVREVPLNHVEVVVLAPTRIWAKRPVADAANVELRGTHEEELAPDVWPTQRWCALWRGDSGYAGGNALGNR